MTAASERVRPGLIPAAPVLAALAAAFLIDALSMMVVVVYGSSTYLLDVRHAPASYPGYAIAIYALVKLLGALGGGRLLERVNVTVVIAGSAVLQLAGIAVMLVSGNAEGFLAGVALLSGGVSVAWLVVYLAAASHTGAGGRGTAAAYLGLTAAAAAACGAGAASVLSELAPWRAVFLLAAAASAVQAAALVPLAGAAERSLRAHHREDEEHERGHSVRWSTRAIVFLHYALLSAILAAYGPLALRTLGLSLTQALVAAIPGAIAGGCVMLWSGRSSTKGARLRLAAPLYLLAAGGALLTAFTQNGAMFALAAIPLAAGIAGSLPLINAGLMDASQSVHRAGEALGLLFFAEGLGGVAGAATIAVVVSLGGVRPGVGAVACAGLLLAILARVGTKRSWL